MKLLLIILAVISQTAFAAQDPTPEPEITINVRGYEPTNFTQEIVKQEHLFRNIVVELEFSIDNSKTEDGKPVVQVMPSRSELNVDPRF
jgi:hypothetical protein